MVYLLADFDLPIRGRTYREPEAAHVAIGRGQDLDLLLRHAARRTDCSGIAVVGARQGVPVAAELSVLAGRRLLVVDSDRSRMRALAEAGLRARAEVEWALDPGLPAQRLAEWALPVAAVVLAAGAGSRMGTNKLLLDLGGRPLVAHVLEAALEGGCHLVEVVYSDRALADVLAPKVTLVHNPQASSGIASSLKVGLAALPDWVQAAMILLGDQPLVGEKTVASLIKAWRQEDALPAVAVAHAKGWAPPIVIERGLWPELMRLEGDAGARQVLGGRPDLVQVLGGAEVGEVGEDVDTPDDYARVVRLFPPRQLG